MNRKLVFLLLAVLTIKAVVLILDSEPSFEFGDSASYLGTALNKWIPPDRSFVYGFILRRIVVRPHSLLPLVVVQAILSGFASWSIGVCLARYLGAKFALAALCSITCALEPLQLMFERFVLTESMSVFTLALLMLLSFSYLRTGNLPTLALIQIVGVFLFSLRYSYLPLILALSFLLPFLAKPPHRFRARTGIILSVVLSVGLNQLLLLGYRHLYGALVHGPAEYTSQDGIFLAGDMAPIIKPTDFPLPEKRQAIFGSIKIPLADPVMRRAQRWMDGGLCQAIQTAIGNEAEANRLARKTALRAMKRDPFGVLRLAAFTFSEFFNHERMRWNLALDQGRYVDPTPGDIQTLKRSFGVDLTRRSFTTFTKRWQERSVLWCGAIVAIPLIYLLFGALRWRQVGAAEIACAVSALAILAAAVIPVDISDPRYIVPLAWIAFLSIGSILSKIF